jgi:exonuclease III
MKFLSWNCQGLGNPKTVRVLKKLLTNYQPDLIFIMETKLLNPTFSFIKNMSDTYSVNSVNCSTIGGAKLEALPSFGITVTLMLR